YPAVRRWAEAEDVLQNALLRLLRALEGIQPGSMREFFGLAALQIRRELLDLAKQLRSAGGRDRPAAGPGGGRDALAGAPGPRWEEEPDLGDWEAFHRGVDALPAEQREVVGLLFYHGWSQAEVAQLFGVTERTVRRWWRAALQRLQQWLHPPGLIP